jgi:hypothetical protein
VHGYHAPLEIAVPIIVAVIIVKVVVSRLSGRPALVGKIRVRCSQAHVFTTTWSPLGSFTSIRLGDARFQRCPVGHHWTLVRPVLDGDTTGEDRQLHARDRT